MKELILKKKQHYNTSFSFSFYFLTFLLSLVVFQQASCQWPGRVDNGTKVGHSYKHGDTVQYVCNNGYILNGKQNLTCADGEYRALIDRRVEVALKCRLRKPCNMLLMHIMVPLEFRKFR